jgi:hypothetical protein
MRTAIFMVGLLIADAINHQAPPTDLVIQMNVILFFIFSFMDIIEFLKNLSKKK